MALQNSIKSIILSSIDSATFTGSFQVINANGLPKPCSIIRIINNSNKDVTISYDGLVENDFIPVGNTLQLPFESNSQPQNHVSLLPQGTKIWVKGAAGTGLVYLAGYYQYSPV